MGSRTTQALVLELEDEEVVAIEAAITSGLEEIRHTQPAGGEDERRLRSLQQRAGAVRAGAPCRLALDAEEAEVLRRYVAMVMIMRGYFVGRPSAINALLSIHSKLNQLWGPAH